ncbi:MAG: sigma-70 family RNA polymerase sigma factor [Pseudonocardiaceae bacterium]
MDDEFNGFFRKEYSRVVKVVMYAGATLEESEDAVSSAMAQAYARWPWLTQPDAWVRTVALRSYLKKVAKDRRRGQLEMTAARQDCLDRVPVGVHEEPDERSRVIAVLSCLPPAQRTVMALTLDGYTPTEIAQMLHQRAETVRSNLRHARWKLRGELKNRNDRKETGLD